MKLLSAGPPRDLPHAKPFRGAWAKRLQQLSLLGTGSTNKQIRNVYYLKRVRFC